MMDEMLQWKESKPAKRRILIPAMPKRTDSGPDSVQNTAGATVMGVVVLLLTWACATGIITTASRMTWSFARDKGMPFSSTLSKVTQKKRIPVVALFVATGFACLLTLIYVGSYTAFNDVISLTVTGFYSSYLIPAGLLLYHRIKGNLAPHGSAPESHPGATQAPKEINDAKDGEKASTGIALASEAEQRKSMVAQASLVWGPFHLPGLLGIINNAYACVYMVFVIFWSVWPPDTPVNYTTMNYSVVVTGGVIIFSIVWYLVHGKQDYHGPTVDEDVAVIMRAGSVVAV